MKNYISGILPRISKFSDIHDRKELLIDQPRILFDKNDYHQYIFKKDGKLIVSVNSEVEIGSWDIFRQREVCFFIITNTEI